MNPWIPFFLDQTIKDSLRQIVRLIKFREQAENI